MSDIKQSHSYSEFHDFNSGRANLSWAGGDSVNKLILGGSYAFTDEELQGLVDLINEFLLWKKYRYTATINEGDSFKIRTKAELEVVVAVAASSAEDATGVPF